MKTDKKIYQNKDIAFIIPTKNRPLKIENLLKSFQRQDCICGRIIIVDGGKSVKDVVIKFSGSLPVEYYTCFPPGLLPQRNRGISVLNDRTPLVGFFDDDIVLQPGALNAMINFWNTAEVETAGVSFNIINHASQGNSRWQSLLGLSVPEPGRVLRSGVSTSNCNVRSNIRVQWLCGGATIWKREILKEFCHKDISSRWAIAEDLIFSYPIGKKYHLYVCADARVRHEHEMDYVKKAKYWFHGYTQTIWTFYFVKNNKDLSIILFLWTVAVRMLGKFFLGIFTFQKQYIEFALGQMYGMMRCLFTLLIGRDLLKVLADE